MDNAKVSIVVPIFNISQFISDCVNSLLSQTYKNIEVILVDDGSTDCSYALCEKWSLQDNRIKVCRKSNGGVSSARNMGIINATGEYIMFVDGDDWIDRTSVEFLVSAIERSNVDASFCSKYYKNEATVVKATSLQGKYESLFVQKEHLYYRFIASPCLMLIKFSKIDGVLFNESIHTLEDWEFNFKVLLAIKTLVVVDKPYYHYRTVHGSASLSPLNLKKMTCFNIVHSVDELVKDKQSLLGSESKYVSIFLLYHMLVVYSNNGSIEHAELLLRKKARENLHYALYSSHVSFKTKSYVFLASIHPIFFSFFFFFKNNIYAK